jgi:Pyocin activator protein PrtN
MSNANNSNPVFATSFLLLAQYGGKAVIPLEFVRGDYFPHMTINSLLRKTTSGELALPIVRIEDSQKAAKGVHLSDLALYIDARVAAARKECEQLTGEKFPDGR